MKISAKTKISELIRFNADSINAISSIHKNLEKLRNPLLRKVLASRVTISDAARISGADIQSFYKVLQPLGFDIPEGSNEEKSPEDMNELMIVDDENTVMLDVRPLIASNNDPFHMIMKSLASLPPDGSLHLINSFEPVPLYKVLECKGYTCQTQKTGDVFHVMIRKNGISKPLEAETIQEEESYEDLKARFGDNLISLDVRMMEMPMPMITILKAFDELKSGHAIHVVHRKFPHLLVPELDERKGMIVSQERGPGEIHLLIFRK